MSANQSCDITRIQDEDVLRKMWQDTEDFGRKKEIRSHMYKIREARLKEFYSSGDINKELQRKDMKQETTHHADSLIDQSFLSLKSKEIRDSESPTRDISTFKAGEKSGLSKTWNVKEKSETTEGGKRHTTSRSAETSGTDKIAGGLSKYAAKQEQLESVFQDGDDKNFVKEAAASSQSVVKQEATGGDENSKFYSSSTSSKSSSKFVSEQKSSSETPPKITYTTQTETIPVDFKQHPNYVEGKTRVFTETKTLPDGSTVTTTRYETIGGKTTQQTTSNQRSTTEKKSSQSRTIKTQEHVDTKHASDVKSIKDTKQISEQDQYRLVNDEIHLANKYHTKSTSKEHQDFKENIDRSIKQDEHISLVNKSVLKDHQDHTQRSTTKHEQVNKSDTNVTKERQDVRENINRNYEQLSKTDRNIVKEHQDLRRVIDNKDECVSKFDKVATTSIQQKQIDNKVDDVKVKTVERVVTNNELRNKNDVINNFIETEKHHVESTQRLEEPPKYVRREEPQIKPDQKIPASPKRVAQPKEESPEYVQPERRQPIQPPKSEMDTKSKPTEGQYDTTYRTDYTNKRVSVDISPTHDAFARSLRSVTPERDRYNKRSSPVRSSPTRNISTPTRNSTTPTRNIERYYPTSRSSSPRKSVSPDKYTSTETITKTTRHPSPRRTYSTETVTKTQNIRNIKTERTDIDSGTITRRKTDRRKSPSPSSYTTAKKFDDAKLPNVTRPTNLVLTKTSKPKKVSERSPTSPIKASPNEPRRSSLKSPHQSPIKEFKPFTPSKKDKPILRRRDTYEERCREILGISERKDEIDVEKYKRQSKSTSPKRVVYDKPEQAGYHPYNTSGLQEYPAQRRKSPEKQIKEKPKPINAETLEINESISSSISLEALTNVETTSRRIKNLSPDRRVESPLPTSTKTRDFQDVSPVRRVGSPSQFPEKGRDSPDRTTRIEDYERTETVEDSFEKDYKYTSLDDLTTTKSTHSRETTPSRETIKKQRIQPQESYANQDFPEYVKKTVKPSQPEDEIIAKSVRYLKGERIPVDEPMITKKFIEKLGSDDEEDDFKAKNVQKQKNEKVSTNLVIKIKDKTVTSPKSKEKPYKLTTKEVNETINRTKPQQPKCVTVKKHTIISNKDDLTKRPKITTTKINDSHEKINKHSTIGTIKTKKVSSDNLKNIAEIKVIPEKPLQPRGKKCCDHSKDKPTSNGITNITIKTSRKVQESYPQIKVTTVPQKPQKTKPIETTTVTKKITKKVEEPERLKKPITNNQPKKLLNGNNKPSKTCISTKSIVINDAVADQREIIVDLKRSQSSREESPDNVWPVSTEEDSGIPRYPDQISEPEEPSRRRNPTKIRDIPLTESEDVTEFTRITEMVDTKITDVDRVAETDDCLLTVNEKVSKFTHTADNINKKPGSLGPAPKVERPTLVVDESLESDECLLSVSDKVNKFRNVTDRLGVTDLPERPKSPRCKNFEGDETFTFTKNLTDSENTDAIIDEYFNIDDSVVDKKIDITEKFIDDAKNVSTQEIVDVFDEKFVRERVDVEPTKKKPERVFEATKDVREDKVVPADFASPPKQFPDSSFETPKCARPIPSKPKTGKAGTVQLKDLDVTPKSARRPTPEGKVILSDVGRLRSTESIKKARALFENIDKTKPKQKDILSRPSVFENRKSPPKDVKTHEIKTKKVVEEEQKIIINDDEQDIPGYMRQLDRSLRARSPHKESVSEMEEISKKHVVTIDEKQSNFGVVLKKTSSDKKLTRKSSSVVLVEIDGIQEEMEIEEIFSLEILEKLLETVIGYEIRKRIRAQIRVVKRLEEEKHIKETHVYKAKSPDRVFTSTVNKHPKKPEESSTCTKQYKSTTTVTTERRQSQTRQSPVRTLEHPKKTQSPIRKSPEKEVTPQRPQTRTYSKSPERRVETKLFRTELRPAKPSKKELDDKKPEWLTKTTLRKVSERVAPTTVKTTSTRSVTSKTEMHRVSPSREEKVTDLITSSYGVGPTDENGTPLFGLRALRAQNNKKENIKVKGVVMQSSYVSKNGEEPSGEISVTQYSSDPRDLGPGDDLDHNHGILSKTITKKFGKHDTTSRSITDKKYASNNEERKTTSTKKVSRRGSVKEMSQKFLENAVETIKNERNSSYPKAGLILRSSSFKDSSGGTSREGSPDDDNEVQRNVKVTSKSTSKSNTFLTNSSKVTNVQDVITRMKNEDVREGDSFEDTEARSMLNKFLGAQVILSGMESHVTTPKKSGSNKLEMTASTSSTQNRTTKITTTISENGIPKTFTRVFTHPITADDLTNIWDEETLRFLLEQSSEYEERRVIRARLKEIMAANEACSDYVEKTIEESQAGDVQETVETSKETFSEGPFTRTEVTTTRVSSQQISKKPMSPFAKFRQLDKQNSLNTPPSTPKTPTSGGPMFKFTDPNLSRSASTIKERLLQWCQMKTKEYENIKLDNFSTSWADGLAFCALIHHFLPDAFDYHQLTSENRRHNFTLAFKVADEKADIFPLLDVDDMVATRRPDWKCVFTYVQAIYRRFKDED